MFHQGRIEFGQKQQDLYAAVMGNEALRQQFLQQCARADDHVSGMSLLHQKQRNEDAQLFEQREKDMEEAAENAHRDKMATALREQYERNRIEFEDCKRER